MGFNNIYNFTDITKCQTFNRFPVPCLVNRKFLSHITNNLNTIYWFIFANFAVFALLRKLKSQNYSSS